MAQAGSRGHAPEVARLAFAQTGRASGMIGLCLKIFLLGLVTLTLYRYWGRTEVRRYLWGHTTINGEPLDYLGKGSELLIGFLLALVFYLVPLAIAVQLFALLWSPHTQEQAALLQGGLSLVYLVGIGFLVAMGVYQAWRYRLSRTAWHGVRFALTGSALGFGLKFLVLAALNILFLGWLTPLMDITLFRTIARNTYFGDKPFRFEGRILPLYGPFAISYFLLLFGFAGLAVGMAKFGPKFAAAADPSAPPTPEAVMAVLPYLVTFGIGAMLLGLLFGAIYLASRMRVMGSGLRYEGLSFQLKTGALSYLWLNLTNALLLGLTLGLALPITELRRFNYIFSRLSAEGEIDFESIGQATGPRPRFGEGLAEAFGLGNV